MEKDRISSVILESRKKLGLTQKQLAEKLSVTDKAISKWESGRGYPDVKILPELANALNTTVDELLIGKNNEMQKEIIREISDEEDKSNETELTFCQRRYTKIFIIIPVVLFLLFFLLSIIHIATNYTADNVRYVLVDSFIGWFILSMVTGFIPLTVGFVWNKLLK